VDWPYPIDGFARAKDYYPLKNPTVVLEISPQFCWVLIAIGVFIVEAMRIYGAKLSP